MATYSQAIELLLNFQLSLWSKKWIQCKSMVIW